MFIFFLFIIIISSYFARPWMNKYVMLCCVVIRCDAKIMWCNIVLSSTLRKKQNYEGFWLYSINFAWRSHFPIPFPMLIISWERWKTIQRSLLQSLQNLNGIASWDHVGLQVKNLHQLYKTSDQREQIPLPPLPQTPL